MRGGARKGAGRKAPGGVKVAITTRILPESHEKLQTLREQGFSIAEALEKLIEREWKRSQKNGSTTD